jgi:hypothetical protein
MKCKIAIAGLVLLLLATNAWHFYGGLDQGVTLMYREQMLYQLANELKATAALANVTLQGMPRAQALTLLARAFPGEAPLVKDGTLSTTWLTLELDSADTIKGVALDETASRWSAASAQH